MSDVAQFSSDKIINKEHIGRVAEWIKGKNVAPLTTEIDMTNNCNNKCRECAGGRTGKEYIKEPFKIVEQLAKIGNRGIVITGGGEAMIDKRTPDIIEHIQNCKMDAALISNGSILREPDKILKNSTWLRISLDASNPCEYRYSHGMPPKAFWKVIENIKEYVKIKKENNYKVTLGLGYTTNEETLGGMLSFTRLGKELGVDYVQFRPYHYDRTLIYNELIDCLKLSDENFKVLYSKHKYDSMKRNDYGRYYKKCYGINFVTTITASSDITICCHTRGNPKYTIGNLEQNTFEEIWNSERRKRIIESIDFRDCPPLCRCNTFNIHLWNIKQDIGHINFL
jgi:radical SAM protein with 4Fe4S-binding SPASM domain